MTKGEKRAILLIIVLIMLIAKTNCQIFSYKIKETTIGPDVWWNGYDGFKTGVFVRNDTLKRHNYYFRLWYNLGWPQDGFNRFDNKHRYEKYSYAVKYQIATERISKNSRLVLYAKNLDGLIVYDLKFEKEVEQNRKFFLEYKCLFRSDSSDLFYLLYPGEWGRNSNEGNYSVNINSTIKIGVEIKKNRKKRVTNIRMQLLTSLLTEDYNNSSLSVNIIKRFDIGKFTLKTRTFLQYGFGELWPEESALFLAGANPEDMIENEYTRAVGFVPYDWLRYGITYNHFHAGGGLNLRGYSGYLSGYVDKDKNNNVIYKGKSGASLNAELEFDRLFDIKPKLFKKFFRLKTYLFGDIGVINANEFENNFILADIRTDFGVGTALTIKKWPGLINLKPFTIRFDAPLLLNHPPAIDPDFFKYRWILAVNRAF